MTATCVLCGGSCPRRFEVKGYAVHRCARCDLEFVHPTPTSEAIAAVYASDYFEGGAYADYFSAERDLAERKARARLDALASLGVTRGASLDLGCAAGYFVDAALRRGFDAFGVEPSPRARAHCPSSVARRVVEALDDPALPERFDLVTLWDVLEHLTDPLAAVRSIRARLAPRGWLAVVVPAIGNVNTRIAPSTWDQYKPPEHLWFWSLRSLTALLAKHDFDVVRHGVAWERHPRWVDPTGADRRPLVRGLRAVDAGLHAAVARLGGRAWVTDSVAVYARSRS